MKTALHQIEHLPSVQQYRTAYVQTFIEFDPLLDAYVTSRESHRNHVITLNMLWHVFKDTRKCVLDSIEEHQHYDGCDVEVTFTQPLYDIFGVIL